MADCKRETAVVLGAGMAGLVAAAALSEFFDHVLIFEKDELPAAPALRRGVPQGAHVHTFLGFAVQAMDTLLPGTMDALYDAGAVQIRRNQDLWFHDDIGPTRIRDVGLLTPSVTRPLLEHVTRARVLEIPNVQLCEATRVIGWHREQDNSVVGVRTIDSDGLKRSIQSDLCVDCSGRASRLPRWLEEDGLGSVPVQRMKIAMGYTSGFFKPPEQFADDNTACLMLAVPPGKRAAYLTPVDGRLWLATMYGRGGDMAPRDAAGFIEWSRGLAHPFVYERLCQAEPASDFRTYRIPYGIWNRFDRMPAFPHGIIPVGEAVTSFNPMYGQGISLAAGQALALRDALKTGDDTRLNQTYFANSAALNDVAWSVMETFDFAHASTEGVRPHDLTQRRAIKAAIRQMALTDDDLHTLTVRVTHLLDDPSVLADANMDARLNGLLDM